MTRTPAHRKKKSRWDRAIPAPRITFEPTDHRCGCGHRLEVHEGFLTGAPKKCSFFEPGGRNKCQCKKYERP